MFLGTDRSATRIAILPSSCKPPIFFFFRDGFGALANPQIKLLQGSSLTSTSSLWKTVLQKGFPKAVAVTGGMESHRASFASIPATVRECGSLSLFLRVQGGTMVAGILGPGDSTLLVGITMPLWLVGRPCPLSSASLQDLRWMCRERRGIEHQGYLCIIRGS